MRKSSRLLTKKVYIPEENDEEKVRKTEAKKAIIRAEFEKHKKELLVNIADPSKTNEIRLRNQLEEMLVANEKKKQDLQRLENFEENLERENLEATMFYETTNKFNMTKANETFLSAGFHPNRTTSRIGGARENNSAEVLTEKKTELMETLKNIELLIEQEDEAQALVEDKFEELRKNQVLVSKKMNELKRMNEHAEIRFTDLKKIEFLAVTKHATTESNLKEVREEFRQLKQQETTYKMQKEQDKLKEQADLIAKKNELANVMIELDKKRTEHQQKQEEFRKLELQYEDVKDKRKNTKIVTKYIEALNALGKKGNLIVAHQALKDLSERLDNSREYSPFKIPLPDRGSPYNFDDTPKRSSRPIGENTPVRRDSLLDRKYYLEKIRHFYEDHPEGPENVADGLIQQYMDQCYKEESYKTLYEEQQKQKKEKENLLQVLRAELKLLKGKNNYIELGRTGSKILESNEQEAIDSGVVVINSTTTTINQAKFEFENKKESDNQLNLFTKTEAFVMRCYLDSLEMIARFSKIVNSIYNQAGGYISEELRETARNITIQIQQFRKGKKTKQQELSTSQTMSDAPPEIYRTQTDNSTTSDRDKDRDLDLSAVTLDLHEIYEIFLGNFDGCNKEAAEFVTHIRSDIIVLSFITIDDIKSYIQSCQSGVYIEMQMQKVFQNFSELRKTATEHMLQKFDIIYKLYMEVIAAGEVASREVTKFLTEKGIEIQLDGLPRRSSEQNTFVKKALQKKWQNLKDRYEYDPARDYRKNTELSKDMEQSVANFKKQQAKESSINEKESYDKDDVKAKLNEIGPHNKYKKAMDDSQFGTKTLFRGNEEDKKRFQAKKAHEKQKQAIENMTDDDFLDWQREKIKTVKEDGAYEMNEEQLLMKAQADLAQRLSQTEPLEELKKMIENSKFIYKIQILEKQKSVIDGKKSLKHDIVENYIPPDPVKVPKSAMSKANTEYKIRTNRSAAFTPVPNSNNNRLFALATERTRTETDYSDSPKDLSSRAATTKSTSRFKPLNFGFDVASTNSLENEKSNDKKLKVNTLKNLKQWPRHEDDYGANKMASTGSQTQRMPKASIDRGIVTERGPKTARDKSEKQLVKSKSGKIDLPKLDKAGKGQKKKSKLYQKKKRVNSEDVGIRENENLNQFLNLQTDPMLKMVYTPNFFAASDLRSLTLGEDLSLRFDPYTFKAPGLLVSEQL